MGHSNLSSGHNLPPGLYANQIPGNRSIDIIIDRAFERRDCLACERFEMCPTQDNDKRTCGLWLPAEDAAKFEERRSWQAIE